MQIEILTQAKIYYIHLKVVVQPAKELDIKISFAYQILNVIGQMPYPLYKFEE